MILQLKGIFYKVFSHFPYPVEFIQLLFKIVINLIYIDFLFRLHYQL
jgi:hypothetical protein